MNNPLVIFMMVFNIFLAVYFAAETSNLRARLSAVSEILTPILEADTICAPSVASLEVK